MRIALFSSIPWTFLKQRPQAFATELGRLGHEVYYFEPFMFNRCPGCLTREVVKSAHVRESSEQNVRLLSSPYFWSTKKYSKYFFMNGVLAKRIVHLIHKLKVDFIIVQDAGYAAPVISSGVPHAYDHVDDMQVMDTVPTEQYTKNMNRLKKTSAFNVYIQQAEAEKDPKGLFVSNGCYPEEFYPIDCPKKFDAVFIGCIARWCDMDSILKSKKQILLVGPMDVVDYGDNFQKYLRARKENIYYIPEISKDVANLWVNSACVGLVPFKEDHPVVQYAMPVKILEYLLCNLPVVTFRNKGIEHQYGERVTYYSSTGRGLGLDEAMDLAAQQAGRSRHREFASQYSWPVVVKRLEREILQAIKK